MLTKYITLLSHSFNDMHEDSDGRINSITSADGS